jgi:membrane protein DedA with SNARE-associated domain
MARRRRQITIRAVMIAIAVVALCLGAFVDPVLGMITLSTLAIAVSTLAIALMVVLSIVVAALLASPAYLLGWLIHRPRKKR